MDTECITIYGLSLNVSYQPNASTLIRYEVIGGLPDQIGGGQTFVQWETISDVVDVPTPSGQDEDP